MYKHTILLYICKQLTSVNVVAMYCMTRQLANCNAWNCLQEKMLNFHQIVYLQKLKPLQHVLTIPCLHPLACDFHSVSVIINTVITKVYASCSRKYIIDHTYLQVAIATYIALRYIYMCNYTQFLFPYIFDQELMNHISILSICCAWNTVHLIKLLMQNPISYHFIQSPCIVLLKAMPTTTLSAMPVLISKNDNKSTRNNYCTS